jgi:alkylation response protein AidB-like acyl-CoA dehydrogenase
LVQLCERLTQLGAELDDTGAWPQQQLNLCGAYGVYRWFHEHTWGGFAWEESQVLTGYQALSAACLTTTFILTQRTGACRRIETSDNLALKEQLLPDLVQGRRFATVGISHLTTSGRHLARPVLRATPCAGGYRLDGFSPWVTGASFADHVVLGATLMHNDQPTSQQLLVAVPTTAPGVTAPPAARLVGLTASHTGRLELDAVVAPCDWILAGPQENVLNSGSGGSTGGLQTSTLALGLASAALGYLQEEAERRADLATPLEALQAEFASLEASLHAAASGAPTCDQQELRRRVNSLVLRSAQASLAAAKGAGYVAGHPAGRWCREALFFLVWSCPQPVLDANLCELAGISS